MKQSKMYGTSHVASTPRASKFVHIHQSFWLKKICCGGDFVWLIRFGILQVLVYNQIYKPPVKFFLYFLLEFGWISWFWLSYFWAIKNHDFAQNKFCQNLIVYEKNRSPTCQPMKYSTTLTFCTTCCVAIWPMLLDLFVCTSIKFLPVISSSSCFVRIRG